MYTLWNVDELAFHELELYSLVWSYEERLRRIHDEAVCSGASTRLTSKCVPHTNWHGSGAEWAKERTTGLFTPLYENLTM